MNQQLLKSSVAKAAIDYIEADLQSDTIIGVGTGSTANLFIDYLASIKHKFMAAVASSKETQSRLQAKIYSTLFYKKVAARLPAARSPVMWAPWV